jgi:hypothetical protein
MAKRVILETEHVVLWYHTDKKIVHHRFNSFVYGDPLRSCMMEGCELLEKHAATKWLADDRRNSALPEEDLEWTVEVWQPRAIEAGLTYFAVILPKKTVGRMNRERIIKKAEEAGVVVKTFSEPDEGLAWLRSQ